MATFLNVYLTFNGNCQEAFDFYKSVFGGAYLNVARYKDVPAEQQHDPAEGEKIVNVSLPIGGNSVLMGSDTPNAYGKAVTGTNFSVSIHPDSKDEAQRLFEGLSAGGTVTMPMADAFWGAYFGMFTDQFGIQWMINYDYNRQG